MKHVQQLERLVPEYLCHGYEKENNHTKVKAQEAY
jgi:hypothetical protein